jgi:hypothetical protein
MVSFVLSAISLRMRSRRIGAGRWLAAAGLLLAGIAGTTLADPARIVLEDFTGGRVGEFPPGWSWRGKDDGKRKLYVVREENGRRYLNARDDSQSVLIIKKVSWKLRDYPILTWRWRVKALPAGGDERLGPRNDSAAALYVVFSQNWVGIPKQIKYVWSTTLPVGTVADRKLIGRPRVQVLRSGTSHVGEWVTERVNLYDDYRRIWGGEPDGKTVGIAILTDADATRSYAEADYADIVASAK